MPRPQWLKEYAKMQQEDECEEAALVRESVHEANSLVDGIAVAPFAPPARRTSSSRKRAR